MDGNYSVTNNYFVVPTRSGTLKKWAVRVAIALAIYQFVPGVKPAVDGAIATVQTGHCLATAEWYRKPVCIIPRMPWQKQPDSIVERLRYAIVRKESGGDGGAINPHSGALGLGQVMPENVASWTAEALGRSLTPEEFLTDEAAQLKTINHKLAQYWQYAKDQGLSDDEAVKCVAAKWYSGQCDLRGNDTPQTYGSGSYPSIAAYSDDILARFHAADEAPDTADVGGFALSLLSLEKGWGDRPGGTFPLEGHTLTTAKLTSGFGPRTHPVTGEYKPHNGVDFACEVGDAVVAWKSGTVELFSDPSGYGPNGVKIAHGNGSMSLYGHMSQTLVGDGDAVVAGDTIGLCGNQGKSSGPHLHFEIHEGDRPVDPIQYLK